jgi:hypothetical protein
LDGTYTCACDAGFEGDDCETEIPQGDDCEGVTCNDRGTCDPGVDSVDGQYTCACEVGFEGDDCETEIPQGDDCEGVTCNDRGTCDPGVDSVDGQYTCECEDNFTGPDCEQRVDPGFEHAHTLADYREVLRLSVRFYGAQRCGDTDNWMLVDNETADSCHLEDGPAYSPDLDLTGGWHDAGDFIKFTLTMSHSVYALLKAFETFPTAYDDRDSPDYSGAPNGIPDLLDEVKIATDYLLKVHPDPDTLIGRVASDADHLLWVTSPYQSTLSVEEGGGQRPVYDDARADIAGLAAAALALMSQLYAPHDAAYAQRCLDLARSIYAYGEGHTGTTPDSFYEDSSWMDNMMCGAVELYRATSETSYLDDANEYDEDLGPHYWVMDWGNPTDLCRHSLVRAGHADTLERWSEDVERYLTTVSGDPYVEGMAYFLDWGSLRYALNSALSAALYYDVTHDQRFRDFAISQVDYALGRNEYDRSFVVGWGHNPPERPHHANAYGREALDWNLSEPFVYSLDGALVGGPTKEATGPSSPGYEDDIEDWVGNEVTNDYNAALVGSVAFTVHMLLD